VADSVAYDAHSNALSNSIGIETLDGVLTALLNSGCTLPCEITQVFSTAEDNQDQISITLFSGNARLASEAQRLGKYQIKGIAPAPRGKPKISVTFLASERGLRLQASDQSGRSKLEWKKLD